MSLRQGPLGERRRGPIEVRWSLDGIPVTVSLESRRFGP